MGRFKREMHMDVLSLAKKYQEQNIGLRREFHRFPEVSGQEFGTADRIERELHAMGIKTSRCVKNGAGVCGRGDTGTI